MSALHRAAAAAGLQRDWEDANSQPRRVEDAVLEAILSRLDTSPSNQPFVSADAGEAMLLPGFSGAAELVLEDGSRIGVTIGEEGRLSGIDQVGYHRLVLGRRSITLAIAPRRCPQPRGRSWGPAVQIPSLREENKAFGDLGTLAASACAFGRAGAQAIAISPTHALFPADPSRFSPYAPSTRLFHNVLLADPALIDAPVPSETAGDLVEWQAAIPARLAHLRSAFEQASDRIHDDIAAFRARRGEPLDAHARFDALHAALGGNGWRDWPEPYQDPASDAVAQFVAEHHDEVSFYVFLQWLADLSLAQAQRRARETMSIGLIADLAVGMDAGGSHGWSRRGNLLSGLTIGAPPDPLGPEGQNWGITALDPFALARTGYRPFAETIRAALAHAGGIRIDHALGLDRLWVVPEGASAEQGAYLTMPGEHLKRIIAIEAHRANAIVIAEDLGTVPPGFRDDLAKRGMLGMRVLPFERDEAGAFTPPSAWDAEAVAMTGTHDTPTLAGWWTGRDLEWNRRLHRAVATDADEERGGDRLSLWTAVGGNGEPPLAPPLDQVLTAVAKAPCPLAIIPFEDLVGLEDQPNIPGTIDEHPNWRRRMPASTDALLDEPNVARRAALLTNERPG